MARGQYPHGYCPERGSVAKHTLAAEKALGKRLPYDAVVHHVDYDEANYENTNLVICPDEAYHNLLHMRTDALNACGNANWKKCYVCKQYDEESNLKPLKKPGRRVTTFYHSACQLAYKKELRLRKKEEK